MPSTLGEEIYGEVDGGKTKLKSREFLTKRFAKTFWPFLLILFIHKNSLLHQASWNKRKRILQPWIRPLSTLLLFSQIQIPDFDGKIYAVLFCRILVVFFRTRIIDLEGKSSPASVIDTHRSLHALVSHSEWGLSRVETTRSRCFTIIRSYLSLSGLRSLKGRIERVVKINGNVYRARVTGINGTAHLHR